MYPYILIKSNTASMNNTLVINRYLKRYSFIVLTILLLNVIQLHCVVLHSQNQTFSIEFKNAPIEDAINYIESNSKYRFIYNKDVLKNSKQITLQCNKLDIVKLLNLIFLDTSISYKLVDDQIVLIANEKGSIGNNKYIISGRVLDEQSQPLPYVNILETDSKNGIITDNNGFFSLKISKPLSEITASYIGYKRKKIVVSNNSTVTIILDVESTELKEVISIGYGAIRKSNLTGSVSSVLFKNTETTPEVSVDQYLKGKSSGVYVNTSSAEPGGISTVRIRGINSLISDNEPLYVIDGIAMDNVGDGNDAFSKEAQKINPLTYLSPQDISNVEILKDASATAIYGSRGANGVVLITTKSGKKGKINVNLISSLTLSTVRKKIDMLDGPDYARYRNEVRLRDDQSIIYGNTEQSRPENLSWKDWQNEILRNSISYNTRFSVNGGNNLSNFYLSMGYLSNQGIVKNTSFDKGDIRFNYKVDLSESLKLNFNISSAKTDSKLTQTTGNGNTTNYSAIRSMISMNPVVTIVPDAPSDANQTIDSPVDWINNYKDDLTQNTVFTKLGLDYQFLKIFNYEIKGSINYKHSDRFRYYGRTLSLGANGGAAGYSSMDYFGWNLDNLLHTKWKINKNNFLEGVVGVTFSNSSYRTLTSTVSGFPDDILGYEQYGSATVMGPLNVNKSIVLLNSYIARINYSFLNRYLLTVSGRIDGSSKFSAGNRYGLFPAVAVAWRLKEEKFLKNFDPISNFKIRLGWGQIGNQGINAYETKAQYGYSTAEFYPFGGGNVLGQPLSKLENSELTWETSDQINAGIDFSTWNNRLSFTLDVFRKVNKNMLIYKELPPSAGLFSGNTLVNFGSMENKGFDFSVDATLLSNGVIRWEVDANISVYRNKILELNLPVSEYGYVQFMGADVHAIGELQQPANIFIEGKPAGLFFGYKMLGVFQNQADIDAFTAENTKTKDLKKYYFNRVAKPGDIIYQDTNRDGVISAADYVIIGNPNPAFTWGLNSTITYKKFGLSFGLVGVQGKDVFNANLNSEDQMTGGSWNIRKEVWYNRWTGEGTSNYFPIASSSTVYNVISDRLVEDASYVRLSNITLSYVLNLKKIVPINEVKFFITANNLLTLTKYRGYDPEVDSYSTTSMRIGIDNNSYPASKSIIVGTTINF